MKNVFAVMVCVVMATGCGNDTFDPEPEPHECEEVESQEVERATDVPIAQTLPEVPPASSECSGCEGVINHGATSIALHRHARFRDGVRLQVMLTDVSGRLACRAVEDTDVLPGQGGTQILMSLPVDVGSEQGCMEGEYVLVERDACEGMFERGLPALYDEYDGCVAMRRWDADGDTSRVRVARAGLVTLVDMGSTCQAQVELDFDGEETLLGLYTFEKSGEPTVCGGVPVR